MMTGVLDCKTLHGMAFQKERSGITDGERERERERALPMAGTTQQPATSDGTDSRYRVQNMAIIIFVILHYTSSSNIIVHASFFVSRAIFRFSHDLVLQTPFFYISKKKALLC